MWPEGACLPQNKAGKHTALGMWFLCADLCREQVLLYSRGLLRRKKIPLSGRALISPPVFSLFVINWHKETTVTADWSAGTLLSV